MGKKRKEENDLGWETVSNLNFKTPNSIPAGKSKSKKTELPVQIDFIPKFIKVTDKRLNTWRKKLFDLHGDHFFANDYPAKCICLLIITGADGNRYVGTGFLVSPRCVITVGHCVFFNGSWAKEIRVIPGADGKFANYGSEVVTEFVSTNNWTVHGRHEEDYGALILPTDSLFNEVRAHLNFREIKVEGPIIIGGYPANRDSVQVTLHGVSSKILEFFINYDLPVERGNSGSPVYVIIANQIFVVGIHKRGGNPCFAVRVNPRVMKVWGDWITRSNRLQV